MTKVKRLWEKSNCYNNGNYYEELLPAYSWENLSDTKYIDQYLSKYLKLNTHSILELSAGTGRATKILEKYSVQIDAAEPSTDMINAFKIQSNTINLINKSNEKLLTENSLNKYDLIFSFLGPYLDINGTNLLLNNISHNTKGIFVHANRACYEQKLIRTALHLFKNKDYDPKLNKSEKEEKFFNILKQHELLGNIKFVVTEVKGKVKYKSLDFAVESFLNFHFAGVFSEENYIKAYTFLYKELNKHKTTSKEIKLDSGMKIFNIIKNGSSPILG
jgi:hypothetical protein